VSAPEAFDRLLAERQADRLPSVAAAVVRSGEITWANAIGSASYDERRDATPGTQYRIGSITKTFTATAIMQLRDIGALDLDDRIGQHVPGLVDGSPTIRRMLAHLSGLQREVGDMWLTGARPAEEDLDVAFALPPGEAFHYSNRAFGLLGRVVTLKSGVPYTDYVDERILKPLGLSRTTWQPQEPKAVGYLVDEYARTVWVENETELGEIASMGQLWSTVEDLGHWATFLARGDDRVLAAKTVEQMWFPQVMYYPDDWVLGWGLGIALINRGGRIWGGHDGAMAGFLAGLFVDRKSGVGAAAMTNSGTRGDMALFAVQLAEKALELEPEPIEPWRPEEEPPAEVGAILGRWWSEGNEFVFYWEKSQLHAKIAGTPAGRGETAFERDGDGWVAVAGRERGERLRIEGERLVWADYWFTRDQMPFSAF
jgi:CubicO group peptidase (beta-lactamase class C family)